MKINLISSYEEEYYCTLTQFQAFGSTMLTSFKEEMEIEPIKMNEPLMINAWTTKSLGIVKSIKDSVVEMNLGIPICIRSGEKIILSRRINQKWRLIGYGIIIS